MGDGKWVKTSGTRTTSVYHTDPDCRQLTMATNVTELDDDVVERRGLRVCRSCSGSVDHAQSDDPTFAQKVRRAQRRGDSPLPVEGNE